MWTSNLSKAGPAAVSLTCLLIATAGCKDKPAVVPVSGRVTYQGKPVPFGTVMFQHTTGGQPAAGQIQSDGSYSLQTFNAGPGARVGPSLVRITSFEGNNTANPKTLGSGEVVLGKSLLPQKYGAFGSSGLQVEVKAEGEQKFDFNLE